MAEKAGLCPVRVDRLRQTLAAYVERGDIPGAAITIHRHGVEAATIMVGHGDFAGEMPLARDSLYRVGSMTKPVVSVAALSLMEEGRLRLDDRIGQWLPELAAPKVLTAPAGRIADAVPAPRALTVEDLLTHRAGFATALVAQGELGQAVQALTGGLARRSDLTPDAWIALLASLPLARPPGEEVINGFATDVLGVLIARACGKPLGAVLRERIFDPLGMRDTDFWVRPDAMARLTPAYVVQWLSGKKRMIDDPRDSTLRQPPAFESGSAGLVSTLDDYARFGTMLLGGGKLGDRRILSRKTVEWMTVNRLTPQQRAIPFFGEPYWTSRGLGLGVYVVDDLARHATPASIGQYGWGGAFATAWFNDPAEAMSVTMMCNVSFPAVTPDLRKDVETMVYQAIDD